jgi:hypothetical protein
MAVYQSNLIVVGLVRTYDCLEVTCFKYTIEEQFEVKPLDVPLLVLLHLPLHSRKERIHNDRQ